MDQFIKCSLRIDTIVEYSPVIYTEKYTEL